MSEKLSVLRACHRVLKPDAPFVFLVVAVADGLTIPDNSRAGAAGPPCVFAGPGYPVLLAEAGFVAIEVTDLTAAYEATLAASIRARDDHRPALEDLLTPDVFAGGQEDRRRELDAVHDGLLRRYLVSARRP